MLSVMNASPYQSVVIARWRDDYWGTDCDECPGKALCLEIFDDECQHNSIPRHAFACGLMPTID